MAKQSRNSITSAISSSEEDSRRSTIFSIGILKSECKIYEDTTSSVTVTPCHVNYQRNNVYNELEIENDQLVPQNFVIETAQKWLELIGKNGRIHKFPLKCILPKVQMTRVVPPKHLPRDVEVDRRRKQYAKIDLEVELHKAGLLIEEILPTEEQYYILSENAFKHFLPLSFFDDTTYDTHSPETWLKLGQIENGDVYPLPAKAFLPINQSLMEYQWQYASISNYNDATGKWLAMCITDEYVYEIPSVQVMFLAENPFRFIERLKKAVAERNKAENIIALETIIDCVMLQDLTENHRYTNNLVNRLMTNVKADASFKELLTTELYVLFEHLMASYEFERFIKLLPKEFPKFSETFIRDSLPKAYPSIHSQSERRSIKELNINIKERRKSVLTYSLYYTKGGIQAMMNVAEECQYVEKLSIYVCNWSKPVSLIDFLQSQHQNSTNVANYVKETWPLKISGGITTIFRALGKGWLDISLDKWKVYQMCKISRFIEQVKYRMQASIHVCLQKSIQNFTNLLCEPCENFLQLDENYVWTNDYIETEFPAVKPIFTMILSVSEDQKVVYSTNPEDFAPNMKEIFIKALEKCNAIRCIDAETLTNLRFAPNLFILTVELIEDIYITSDKQIQECYMKAIHPLAAYAHKYECFIDFYLLNVQTYMQEYKAAKKPSSQVKQDILEHKRKKEELRQILPASITIGPFLVIVDLMKQHMIRKRIEIVKKIFEYYLDRMYDTNEQIIERGAEIFKKIEDRPQSIEHLYEIRDFALVVPDLVEQLRADIQVMILEYDLLDSFFYNLPDHQFTMKWEAYAWPKIILDRLSTLREEQKADIEEFKRLHTSECIGFEERLESLNDEVQAFSLIFNPEKVNETASEIKKLWRTINDLQKMGETLAYRQELFELEPFSLEFLESIISSFMPYKNLWYACLDLVKLEDATIGNPLFTIELDDVWESMLTIKASLKQSEATFEEHPEIQHVAQYYLNVWDEFVPKYNAMKDMKNEHWLILHWQELANRSGLDIKYSLAMNFQYLIRKGILDHLDLVHEIFERAVREADAIKQAIEEEERRKQAEAEEILMRKSKRKCRTDIL